MELPPLPLFLRSREEISCALRPNRLLPRAARHAHLTEPRPLGTVRERLRTFRTPDVVEFAVSPQVGQAVLAFARSYSSSGLKFSAGGQAAPPAPPAKLSPSKGMAQPIFPARQKSRGDIRSSETCPRFRRSPPRRPPVSRCRRRRHRYRQRRQRPVDRVPTTPTAFQKNATSEVCATQQEQRSGWRHCHYHRCAGQRLCRRLHLLRRFPGHARRRAAQERRPDQPCGGHGSRSRPSSSA